MGCVGVRAEVDLRCGHWVRCGRFSTGLKIKRADEDYWLLYSFLPDPYLCTYVLRNDCFTLFRCDYYTRSSDCAVKYSLIDALK